MRLLTSTSTKIVAAAVLAGGVGLAAVATVRADHPTAARAPALLATESATDYLEHMRSIRKELADAKDKLHSQDMADRADRRSKAEKQVTDALGNVDEEIATYEKDLKSGKGVGG